MNKKLRKAVIVIMTLCFLLTNGVSLRATEVTDPSQTETTETETEQLKRKQNSRRMKTISL